jgi:hypothetical protein
MLTIQQMSVSGKVPESIGQLAEWCELNKLSNALWRHNYPSYDYHLPMHETFVQAKMTRNVPSPHFCLSSRRA